MAQTVYVFNATPDTIDLVLNKKSLDSISGIDPSNGYQPNSLMVQRYLGSGNSGIFGSQNQLKITYSGSNPTKQYQVNIDSTVFPIADDLQLYVFYDAVVLVGPDHDTPSLLFKAQPVPAEG